MKFIVLAVAVLINCSVADATWKPQYAEAPQWVQDWYQRAQLTEEAATRLGFKGCCNSGDVVISQFHLDDTDHANPHWFYMKDGAWIQIPDDIIHWDESSPDNKPTLFALSHPFNHQPVGTLTCFYPPSGGY